MQKRIPLTKPSIGDEELEAIKRVFESGWLTQGSLTEEFERKFAKYLRVRHAIATTSCTTALHLALMCLDIGPGDEVIVPDFTFPATGNVVFHVGAKPVLVDIDVKSYNIDPKKIEEAITAKTKAIIPVHLFGLPAEMKPIMEIATKYNLYIVEDAACGLGATYHGKEVGSFGDIACFSFHPRKVLTTGEGGMLITNDDDMCEKATLLKNHGMKVESEETQFVYAGYNYRLSDVQAAIGLAQLKKLNGMLERRRSLAKYYTELLQTVNGITPPHEPQETKHAFQSYVTLIERDFKMKRDQIIMKLRASGIETQIGTYALHLQPAYRGISEMKLPNSEKAYYNTLTLPLFHEMKHQDIKHVIHHLKNLISARS